MSYDLSVYAGAPLEFDELVVLVRSTAGFDVDGEPTSDADSVIVVRGARRAYCFTIDGPFEVEPEDVPEQVTASIIGAKAMYQVLVEGSEEASISHAAKFARRLAQATDGAMLDEQTDEIWPKPKGKRIAAPSGERITDRVDVVFYFLNENSSYDLPQIFLRVARKYLPEALPRRFGTSQPYRGKLQRDGDEGFIDACTDSDSFGLSFDGSYPFTNGYYDKATKGAVGRLSLSLDKAGLGDPKWQHALRTFFVAFATETRCFFASAEVLRDHTFMRGTFWTTRDSEKSTPGVFRGAWMGLQTYPLWWMWFGPDYLQLVSPFLKGNTEICGDYVFHSWSEEPLNRDQITALLPDPALPWIAVDLQATTRPDGILDKSATIIPPRLAQNPAQR